MKTMGGMLLGMRDQVLGTRVQLGSIGARVDVRGLCEAASDGAARGQATFASVRAGPLSRAPMPR